MERVFLRPPLTAIPSGTYGVLRDARTRLLKFVSPLDGVVRRLRGLEALPPLWLRRHVGATQNYRSSAREMREWIDNLKLVRPGDCVLDIGCGTGVMAFELAPMLGRDGRYIGFDVNSAVIQWARRAFAGNSRFRFELAEVASSSGALTAPRPEDYRFPVEDGGADLVLAKSIFTHLLESEARHYLGEIQRVLRPGRAAVITAFLFAKGSLTDRGRSPIFRFGDERGFLRWRWKAHPSSAVAYERERFLEMVTDAGLGLYWLCQGFWPGNATHFTGQDILFVGR